LSKSIANAARLRFSIFGWIFRIHQAGWISVLRIETPRHQMDHGFFLRGVAIGFSIAAPVGPIGVLCIRRTLAEGRGHGFASGLGAATADAVYGCIAGFGLTAVSDLLVSQQTWLRLIGGFFLCYLGMKIFFARPAQSTLSPKGGAVAGAYLSTLFLTLTNPMTILSFAAVFAGLGLGGGAPDYAGAALLVSGVFLGSALWWLFLSGGVALFREKLNDEHFRWVNRVSGTIVAGFGLACLINFSR
jgi:threonine/homoserine/homoserine lactone efflux protein